MIYFWFPGFAPGTSDLDDSLVSVPWDDHNWDITTVRNKIALRNPGFVQDFARPFSVIIKRSMSNAVRTYITTDRNDMAAKECTLTFRALRTERRLALEHFLRCAEGHYIGYKDPDDQNHVIIIKDSEITLTANQRAGEAVTGNVDDEIHTAALQVMIVRSF